MSIDDHGNGTGAHGHGEDPHPGRLDPALARLFRLSNAEADRVAASIDTDAVLAAARAATEQRRPHWWWVAIVWLLPVCVGVALGAVVDHRILFVLLFGVAPALLVIAWYRQARVPGTLGHQRVGRTVREWSTQLDRQGRALERRAGMLDRRHERLSRLVDRTAELALQTDPRLTEAAPVLADLARSVVRAAAAAAALADRTATGAAQVRGVAERHLRDTGVARSEYGRLPWTVEPRQVAVEVDDLLHELSLSGQEAGDALMRIGSLPGTSAPPAGDRAAEIADELSTIRHDVAAVRGPLLTECRQLLVAIDILDALATAEEIGRITTGPGAKLAATAAMTASALPQPRPRRAAVRTEFLRVARQDTRAPWLWIGSATTAAVVRGLTGTTASGR